MVFLCWVTLHLSYIALSLELLARELELPGLSGRLPLFASIRDQPESWSAK